MAGVSMGVFTDIDKWTDEQLPFLKDQLEGDGLMGALLGFRDGVLLFYAALLSMDDDDNWRNELAWAAKLLCAGTQIDELAWVSDSYRVLGETKTDGSPWEPGDAARILADENSPDRHLVGESVAISLFDRTGTGAHVIANYKRNPDKSVTFGERSTFVEGRDEGRMDGVLANALREAITGPSIERMVEVKSLRDALGLTEEQARTHITCAMVKTIMSQVESFAIALGAETPEQQEIIQRSFGPEGWRPPKEQQS